MKKKKEKSNGSAVPIVTWIKKVLKMKTCLINKIEQNQHKNAPVRVIETQNHQGLKKINTNVHNKTVRNHTQRTTSFLSA
jgi:hypothetical protein